jgi:calpain
MDTIFKRIHCHVTRANNFFDTKIELFRGQNYEEIKRDCLRNKKLFEDPYFPAINSSLFYKTRVPNGIVWKRPAEIVDNQKKPNFIENTANAEDLHQGYIGDW